MNITSDEEKTEEPVEYVAGPSKVTATDRKQYKCNICGHMSDSFVAISRDHLRSHFKPFACDHCQRRFNYPSQVNSHHAKMHQNLELKCTVLEQEKDESNNLRKHLGELGEDGNYGLLSKAIRRGTTG